MNILNEIITWASGLPNWQSDAVRRLLQKGDLSNEDEEDIYLMLKANYQLIDKGSAPNPQPIKKELTKIYCEKAPEVFLKSMHNLKNVNALVENQTVNFSKNGLTIIYGQNASGKSGYSRVLKHACSAREKEELILPNIFENVEKTQNKTEAIFDLEVDGKNFNEKWIYGETNSKYLSEIAVFDSKCVRVSLDEENEVIYIPSLVSNYKLNKFNCLQRWFSNSTLLLDVSC